MLIILNLYQYFGRPKYNCMFSVHINGKDAVINTPTLFSTKENKNPLSKKWIAIQQADGKYKTIDKLGDRYNGEKVIDSCRKNIQLFYRNRDIEPR